MRIFAFLLFLSFASNAQKYSPVVPDTEILPFLNWYFDQLKQERILSREIGKFNIRDFETKPNEAPNFPDLDLFYKNNPFYLTEKDRVFLLKQIQSNNVLKWENAFKNTSFIDYKYSQKDQRTVFWYAVPMFSVDKKTAIFEEYLNCGMLCGGSSIQVFRKNDDGIWRLVREFQGLAE